MQTYSHLIVTAAINSRLVRKTRLHLTQIPPLKSGALLLGSVLPSLPLTLISVVVMACDLLAGVFARNDFPSSHPGAPAPAELLDASLTARLFEVWFYENPWVIAAHSLFHSPLLVSCFILIGWLAWRRGYSPLEMVSRRADGAFVQALRQRFGERGEG